MLGAVDLREPSRRPITLQPIVTFTATLPGFDFTAYEEAIRSPHVTEINNSTPDFWPGMMQPDADQPTSPPSRPIFATTCSPQPPPICQGPSTTRTSTSTAAFSTVKTELEAALETVLLYVDSALGEALGKVYVEHYFAGDSKPKTLEMVHDIEAAMGRDIDQIDWMSPVTKARAHEKLAAVANKLGYPDKVARLHQTHLLYQAAMKR